MDDFDPATARNLTDLARCVRDVHRRADKPTYRSLEQQTIHASGLLPGTRLRRARLTRSILSDVLLGRKFPTKAFLLTFVDSCGIDIEDDRRWEQAWDRLAVQYLDQVAEVETEQLEAAGEPLDVGRIVLGEIGSGRTPQPQSLAHRAAEVVERITGAPTLIVPEPRGSDRAQPYQYQVVVFHAESAGPGNDHGYEISLTGEDH